MPFAKKTQHALITIYGDSPNKDMAKTISVFLPERDIKILTPDCMDTLQSAAQNSVLVFIGLGSSTDTNLNLGKTLQSNPLIASDIIGFYFGEDTPPLMQILSRGFDNYIHVNDTNGIEFKQYLGAQIIKGSRRLQRHIEEDEYKRLNDALSIAPVSLIIFDSDKKAVFVSDHYYRAYPKIAPRLIRGLRVFDAFEMMAAEEGLEPDDPRYEKIQQFWHNLSGTVEFTLADGRSYRLKAEKLSGDQGTVVTGRNITGYVRKS